jgi:hypothetical protein
MITCPPFPKIECKVSFRSSETSKVRVGNVVCNTYGGAEESFLLSSIQFLTSAKVFPISKSRRNIRESGSRTDTVVVPSPPVSIRLAVVWGRFEDLEASVWCLSARALRSALSASICWRILALSDFCWARSFACWVIYFCLSGSVEVDCLNAAARWASLSSLSIISFILLLG